jgi:uncharacterized membrane protein
MTQSRRRLAVIGALVLASAFDVALLAGRIVETHEQSYRFLAWNLFLAWIPLLVGLWIYDGCRRHARRPALLAAIVLWLLFLPNAPYVVTDFVHLRTIHGAPVWFDVTLIASFAFTAMLLGLVSTALVHAVVQRLAGPLAAWSFVGGSLVLSSVGIYIGRFLRLNSWSFLTRPGELLGAAAYRLHDPFGNPKLLAVTVLFSCLLGVGYLVVWALAQPAFSLDRPDRR